MVVIVVAVVVVPVVVPVVVVAVVDSLPFSPANNAFLLTRRRLTLS